MIALNFFMNYWGLIITLILLSIVVILMCREADSAAKWEDKLNTKPPVCPSAEIPPRHAPQFKTPFHRAATENEIRKNQDAFMYPAKVPPKMTEAEMRHRDFSWPIRRDVDVNKKKPHPKPRKH